MFTNQDGSSINITVIEVLQENGTDLLFFTVDNTLYYTYPSCITKFNPNTKNTK